MLISFTLLVLGVLTIFSIVLGSNLIGSELGDSIASDLIVNGTVTTIEYSGNDFVFSIDPTIATIGVFVVIGLIAVGLGVTILGSGLSPESIKIIMAMILYGSVWGLLSVLALPLIIAIESFGTIIYMVLLIGYIVGVVQKVSGSGE